MKNILQILLLLTSLPLAIHLHGCRDKQIDEDLTICNDSRNKACPNYNPCLDAKSTSAAFTMEEIVNSNGAMGWPLSDRIVYDTDTCRNWNDIVFNCTQKADSIWWIFDDTEMRPEWQQKQSFTIKFGNPSGPMQTQPERVKITCIVKSNKQNSCFPDDNGVDTFSRYMVYMPWWQMGFIGKFRGSLKHIPDSIFDLEIRWDTLDFNGTPRYIIRFDNLLVAPPFYTTDFDMIEGMEYYNVLRYGYRGVYLEFIRGFVPDKYNYQGVTQRGKAYYNSENNQIKIDFIRKSSAGWSTISEWPPKGEALYTFIGSKIY